MSVPKGQKLSRKLKVSNDVRRERARIEKIVTKVLWDDSGIQEGDPNAFLLHRLGEKIVKEIWT